MNNKQVVLVSGASSGIGKETARTLISEGYTVYAAARRVEKMEDLKELGGIPLAMDITQEDQVVAVVEQIEQEQGGIDILVNSAGCALYGAVEETTIEDARYQFEVNLFGLARLTQLVLPYMRKKKAGKIINISSMAGKCYTTLGAWYTASKHALEGWSDSLRFEVKQFNIDVIIIEPGIIATEIYGLIPEPMLKRSGQGPYSSMANAVAELCRNSQEVSNASAPPSAIANTVSMAIKASRPRTRYAVGPSARPLIFVRKWFGDRFYDWGMGRSVR
jgi:NAD(P)-dependent dehydrogenase (short-subunit alcohol dehydrogenase family)